MGFGELKLFLPALEQLYMEPTQTVTRHRTPSLISNPLQMIPTKFLPLRTMDERRAIHNTFRLRDLNSKNTDEKSLERGGEEEKRRNERGRIHVCLQGTAENCASTTLIGDPLELDLPTHIEVWLFPFPRLTRTGLAIQCIPLILAAG